MGIIISILKTRKLRTKKLSHLTMEVQHGYKPRKVIPKSLCFLSLVIPTPLNSILKLSLLSLWKTSYAVFPVNAHSRIFHRFKGELSCVSSEVKAQRWGKQHHLWQNQHPLSLSLSQSARNVPAEGRACAEAWAGKSV